MYCPTTPALRFGSPGPFRVWFHINRRRLVLRVNGTPACVCVCVCVGVCVGVCVWVWVGACVTSSHISHSRYMSKGFYSKDFQQCCSCHFVAHTHTHTLRSRHLSICSLCRAHSPSSHRCRPSQEATVSHIPRSRSACSSCRCISCRPRTWCVSCGPLSSERADTSSCCCSSCARRTPA